MLIDDAVLTGAEALVRLAPLHQAHHVATIRAVHATVPRVSQVARFDTAFHRNQPAIAQEFGRWPQRDQHSGLHRANSTPRSTHGKQWLEYTGRADP
ncbi:hypothetical protein KQH60_06900 [Mycetohabitans sp. B8]|uniref:hypothetical protein n=1 Tax=Mycetohabitans sp. B8 TaxID=2841845 RepID=UPI001F2D6AE7|nr:hypothetical protein [Mycetohabitans sp. B8]MCG1042297.1 hypothetical protein [Mycetohabitans sp. B8]